MDIDAAAAFEQHRDRLRGLALRMLGTREEAEDAVHDVWVRLEGPGGRGIDNLGGWLTTVTTRVCLNRLRSRSTRREVPLDPVVPDLVVQASDAVAPEEQTILADDVGAALLVVLDTLSPNERLAFVLHDLFAVPFDEIGDMLARSPEAARQLASRARRRVRGAAVPDADVTSQRQIVDAFFAAARDGDFDRLVSVLHPDVVLRSDGGSVRSPLSLVVHGAEQVAGRARSFRLPNAILQPVQVGGHAGVIIHIGASPFAVMWFTVVGRSIRAIEVLADPERIERLPLPEFP